MLIFFSHSSLGRVRERSLAEETVTFLGCSSLVRKAPVIEEAAVWGRSHTILILDQIYLSALQGGMSLVLS